MFNQKNPIMQVPPTRGQAKLVDTNQRMGNPAANDGQGTTFHIYDSILLDGTKNVLKFFKDAQKKEFPLTNLTKGTLTAGESALIEYAQILFVEFRDPANGDFTVVNTSPLSSSLQFQQADLDFMQGNSRLLKTMKLQTWLDKYNKYAAIPGQNVYPFQTNITIQSFLEFSAEVTLPGLVNVTNTYAQFIIEGRGGILSPKANF